MKSKRTPPRAARAKDLAEGLEEELIPTRTGARKPGQVSTRLKPRMDAAWKDYLSRKRVENGAAAIRWLVYYAITNDLEPPDWVRTDADG